VEDAVLVFEKREDRKQARALKRRHAQVFALESEGKLHALVAEEATDFAMQRPPRTDQRQRPNDICPQQVTKAIKRRFENAAELCELFAVFTQIRLEPRAVARSEPIDFGLHPRGVRRGIDVSAAAEDKPVLRVEADHVDLGKQVVAGFREDSCRMRG